MCKFTLSTYTRHIFKILSIFILINDHYSYFFISDQLNNTLVKSFFIEKILKKSNLSWSKFFFYKPIFNYWIFNTRDYFVFNILRWICRVQHITEFRFHNLFAFYWAFKHVNYFNQSYLCMTQNLWNGRSIKQFCKIHRRYPD